MSPTTRKRIETTTDKLGRALYAAVEAIDGEKGFKILPYSVAQILKVNYIARYLIAG